MFVPRNDPLILHRKNSKIFVHSNINCWIPFHFFHDSCSSNTVHCSGWIIDAQWKYNGFGQRWLLFPLTSFSSQVILKTINQSSDMSKLLIWQGNTHLPSKAPLSRTRSQSNITCASGYARKSNTEMSLCQTAAALPSHINHASTDSETAVCNIVSLLPSSCQQHLTAFRLLLKISDCFHAFVNIV